MKKNNHLGGIQVGISKNYNSLYSDVCTIIEEAREGAYRAVNVAMIQRNWQLGKRITEEILQGDERAEYGTEVISTLSKELTKAYGKGFTKSYLYTFVKFYKVFPEIFQSPIGKSELLTWTHYYILLDVINDDARRWYAHEAYTEGWSVRTLRRNIGSQYYFRLLQSQNKQAVIDEMKQITSPMQGDKLEFIKKPCCCGVFGTCTEHAVI